MTLDRLYYLARRAKYPIIDRKKLRKIIGKEEIFFEGKLFNAEEIAVHINEYPIHSASDLIKFFIEEEVDAYNIEEAKSLGDFETRMESKKRRGRI